MVLLIAVFANWRVPDLHTEDENRGAIDKTNCLQPSRAQLVAIAAVLAVVCGLLYFFIAPILGLIWTLLHMDEGLLQATKLCLLVVAYVAAFLLVSKTWDMFRRRHFTLGIAAQFFCVAGQTGIFSFCVNYILENDPGVTRLQASKWLGAIGFVLFMIGRLCGSAVISQFKPERVLTIYAVFNVALIAIAMGGGKAGLYAMFGTFFFHVRDVSHYLCAGHPRAGRLHQIGFVAHRNVYCRRCNCSAVYGTHRGCAFYTNRICGAAGLFCVYRSLWFDLGEIQQAGFVA